MKIKNVMKTFICSLLLVICTFTVILAGDNTKVIADEDAKPVDKLAQMLNLTDEQTKQLLESMGVYVKEEAQLESYNDLEERTIIVMLDGNSLYDIYNNDLEIQTKFEEFSEFVVSEESFKEVNKIESKQELLLRTLKSMNINYELKYTYSTIFNGVSIHVDSDDIPAISALDFVENVIYSEKYAAPSVDAVKNNVDVYTTGIYNTSNIEYTGKGMVVAVLDTGIDYKHNAFSTMPNSPRLSFNDVDENFENFTFSSSTSLSAESVYINSKIPFAYDYADSDADVFPTNNVHGVHVAGIIAGQDSTVTEEDHEVFANGNTFKGVAPDAQLAVMKVFSDYDAGAGTDAILAALSDSVALGVDVINMSLGSSAGFSRDADNEAVNIIYDKVRESGISLVVAAGNSYSSSLGGAYGTTNLTKNPDSGTVGSPSSYDAAISVASVSGQLTSFFYANDKTAVYFNESSNASSDKYDFVKELLNGEKSKTFNYVVVGGYGKEFNYTPAIKAELAKGNTIAIVKRGDISFEDKQKIAYENGAVGCVIYNNVSGTISASLGNGKKIPTCTISMDMAAQFVSQTTGTLSLSTEYKAGPFMSDFSSWGPTADLELKPEITAHGGEIISAVVGGYAEFSGTSMACPNLAGVTALLRQYVKENLGSVTKDDANQIADLVYQLLMSTATICNNNEGNPYSPRKQGAGLADISKAMATEAYLYVPGTNKTKLSLGDDKEKTGEYTLRFNLKNMSGNTKVYTLDTLTMTETVSSDGITVAEKAYMLGGGIVTYSASNGGSIEDGVLVVDPYADVELVVTIQLNDAEKEYLNNNFENGMYVEGFVCLKDASLGNAVDLNIPWLAFYGDWLDAPVFDASSFEVSDSYFDDTVDEEDKLIADVYETKPIAKYYNGTYYMPLGEYIFIQPEGAEKVRKSTDKVAISYSEYASHELYAVYCGLLRSAKAMEIVVTNSLTGEVVYEKVEYDVRKSYGAGSGSSYPGAALMELSPADLGLANNTQYNVTLTAALDYQDGKLCNKSTYEFSFWVDFEMPTIVDYNYRFKYNKEGERTVYMDIEIYDNHYSQSLQIFTLDASGNIQMLTDYPIVLESARNSTTKVTVDITNWLETCNSNTTYPGTIGVYMYDYALNSGGYLLPILYNDVEGLEITASGENVNKTVLEKYSKDVLKFSRFSTTAGQNYLHFNNTDETLVLDGVTKAVLNGEEVEFEIKDNTVSLKVADKTLDKYTLELYSEDGTLVTKATYYQKVDITTTSVELCVGDLFEFDLGLYSSDEDVELLIDDVTITMDRKYFIERNGTQIHAIKEGVTKVTITANNDPLLTKFFKVIVVPREEGDPVPSYKLDKLLIDSYKNLATGITVGISGNSLSLDCGSRIKLNYNTQPWYATDVNVTWESADPYYATVDKDGNVTCLHQGSVDIWAKCQVGNLELIKSITLIIDEEYTIMSGYLYQYNGAGGEDGIQLGEETVDDALIIPADLGAIYLSHYSEGVAGPFYGVQGIKTVVVPEGITSIGTGTFAYTDVETLYLPSTLELIGTQAFMGCSKLKNVYWIEEAVYDSELGCYTTFKYSEKCTALNLTIGAKAFSNNRSLVNIDLSRTTAILDSAFNYCQKLETVDLSALRYAGSSIFTFCYGLKNVISSIDTTYGKSMFWYCTSLTEFDYYDDEVYANIFYYCKNLQKVTFHNDLTKIGIYAFQNCTSLNTVDFNGHTCGEIGAQAFSGCSSLSSFHIPNGVKSIGNYAFRNCSMLITVSLGRRVNLETIGMNLFYGCNSLTSFTLPEGGSTYYTSKKVIDDNGKTYYFLYSSDEKTLIFSAPSFQYSEEEPEEGYTQEDIYNFFDDEGNLIATEIGAYAYSQTSVSTAKPIDELIIPEGITKIGNGAFFNNAIKRVVLPSTLEELGEYAFYGCSNLVEVVFQSNIKRIERFTFYNCSSLTTIELPASLEYLGESAIRNCAVLTYIKIPASVRIIDSFSFMNNVLLETVEFEEGSLLEGIGVRAFSQCASLKEMNLPKNIKALGAAAFEFCTSIEEIVIPGSLEVWGDYLFAFCTSLEKVEIEEGVEYIGNGAFMFYSTLYSSNIYYNTALKEVIIPDSLKAIYPYAFAAVSYIEKIDLKNVEYIYDYAFLGCEAITDVKLGADVVEYIGTQAFYATPIKNINLENVKLINAAAFYNCTELSAVNLDSLEQLGAGAFYGCTNLYKAYLPNCTDIYSMAFMNCKALNDLDISSAKLIGEAAFFGCSALTNVTLSSELETIDSVVFAGCSSLESIELNGESETYFTDESGVLYKKLANGTYELVVYPGGNTSNIYSILEGTSRVGNWAFAYCYNLTQIDIAATVKSIGAYAFYGVGMGGNTLDITYNFKGLNAPTLEAEYADSSNVSQIYTNFSYNFGYIQTNINVPSNGIGYDTFIYDLYFKDPVYSAPVMEETTKQVYDLIDKLAGLDTLTQEDVNEFYRAKQLLSFLSNVQKALVTNSYKLIDIYDKVLEFEKTSIDDDNNTNNDSNVNTPSTPDTPEEPGTTTPPTDGIDEKEPISLASIAIVAVALVGAALYVYIAKFGKKGGNKDEK